MADARVVANRLLEMAAADGRSLTPMQVLKLVYISHGWSLGLYGKPLIDQPVEAWQYGPVISDLYNAMRKFGGNAVQGPLSIGWGSRAENLTGLEDDLLGQVYKLYGHINGVALSRITHAPNTPWAQTYAPGKFGTVIPTDMIADHYQRLASERSSGGRG
ncbi:Panacea domain-containing protein [Sphingomonas oligoaromativorans]|uniref:Panacea domain-containing protein n=1 Tax=Sphingomonas oligoaromativorans TaxID=575322 RepID=UPI001422EABB|nr:type II toxin-antitoxin system antitoxin SocA domain-containing protein [Sphingomonas oligoaromativorans]NIJ34300.1 putative phage-associated protein [Sphingomonas oligoaromativorans]